MILGFDTSGPYCSVTLLADDVVRAQCHVEMVKGQAERLMPLIEQTLHEAGTNYTDLTRLAVGTGPGNFTGIRISVAAARGLALSLGIPALGVTLFEALAHEAKLPAMASLPATKNTIYTAELTQTGISTPVQSALEDAPAPSGKGFSCIGYNADALSALLGLKHTTAKLSPSEAIARVAAKMDAAGAARPAPFYLRPADAAPPRDPAPVILDA
ncbi:MAG: tRNA (adenosine(37)-N6)-threonylcarbamoyltransferase complex dimerization subunit type 1 TsaB [Pseudomonadota bacterium]